LNKESIGAHALHLVTDRKLAGFKGFLETIESAVKAGVTWVQYREKVLGDEEFYRQGMEVKEIAKAGNAIFIVNDRAHMVKAMNADGAHLGPDDLSPDLAREILGPDKIIGYSVKHPVEINKEIEKRVDYLGIGPIYATNTKKTVNPKWGLEGISTARKLANLPLVAIGGISLESAYDVIMAGADSIAVVSAIMAAEDPSKDTREILKRIGQALDNR
jgi:thiamine-phosphate pyrophosphorylase